MEPKDLKNPEGLKSTQKTIAEKDDNIKKPEEVVNAENSTKNTEDKGGEAEKNTAPDEQGLNEPKEKEPETKEENQEHGESKVPKEKEESGHITSEASTESQKEAVENKEENVKPKSEPNPKLTQSGGEKEETKESKISSEISEEPREGEATKKENPPEPEKQQQAEAKPEENSGSKEEVRDEEQKTKETPEPKKETSSKKDKKEAEPQKQKEKPDYNKYTQVELVNALREILKEDDYYSIKDEVEAIKAAFYKQVKDEAEQQKKVFIEEGGDESEFKPGKSPYEEDIKDLLKRYRHLRTEHNRKLEQEKEVNLQLKYEVIEEIKGLLNKEESINKTFQDFRDLQHRWREIGLVPQSKVKDLWETYHFHVENFYDYIKINKELRDLDLKKNLEMKIRLCEQAEELLLEPNIIKAFNALQKLHERWREIGPVPRENKDDLWDRFKASTAKINKKHQEYFDKRKAEQKKNLEAKRALCEQVEEINEMDLNTHKEWGEKSKEVINIQKIWRTIGFAPRKDNNKIYDRFRKACDSFFDAKREFYAKNKELQQNNLQLKIDLCMQAEALKDNTEWRKTTQDFINIQKQWKEIGPVPRKQSDAIWKRFRAACDHFFNKKSDHFSNLDSEQVENLKKKEQLIKDVESFESKGDVDENLKNLKDFQRRWTEIGHVPIKKKDQIQKQFRDAINKLFDDLNIDESKRNLLNFRTKMASFSETSRGQNKMQFERDKYMSKLKQLENDLVLLDNNVGFFAKSKNAESLIEDVNRKIEQTKEKIEFLKEKIRVIDEMDDSEE
jgi:hypothetical protein